MDKFRVSTNLISPFHSEKPLMGKTAVTASADDDNILAPLYQASSALRRAAVRGRFRPPSRFKPLRILQQILLLQLAFWATIPLFALLFLTVPSAILASIGELEGGWRGVLWPTVDLVLRIDRLSLASFRTMINCVCFLATGFVSAYYLRAFVSRSRLCLDFAFTCHFIHLLTTIVYSRAFPLQIVWWLVMAMSAWMMTERGRMLCLTVELLPISMHSTNTNSSANSRQSPSSRFSGDAPVGLFGYVRRGLSQMLLVFGRSRRRDSGSAPADAHRSDVPLRIISQQ